jgi:hypothetical protein
MALMSGEKFYFASVKLAKDTIKKNIVQVNQGLTFVNFVNKPFLLLEHNKTNEFF